MESVTESKTKLNTQLRQYCYYYCCDYYNYYREPVCVLHIGLS